jgi:hypothetical protein
MMWVKRQTTKGAAKLMKHLFPKVCNFSLSVLSLPLISGSHFQTAKNTRRNGEEVTGRATRAFPLFPLHKWHSRTNTTRHLPARRSESGAQTSGLFVLPPIMHPAIAIVLNQVADSAYFCPSDGKSLAVYLESWNIVIVCKCYIMVQAALTPLELMCCTAHISAKCTRTENEWASALPAAVSLTLE